MSNYLTTLIGRQAAAHGSREAFRYKPLGQDAWQSVCWSDFADNVSLTACALETLDIKPGDTVAVFSANTPEILTTDFACFSNRAIPVSIYATSSASQVEYILRDCKARIAFAGDQGQLQMLLGVRNNCPKLQFVVTYFAMSRKEREGIDNVLTFDELLQLGRHARPDAIKVVDSRTAEAVPDDIATLIYTSGTTGEPKGAVLTHDCFNAAIEMHQERLSMVGSDDLSLCFLPLSHIFEKAWTYFCLNQLIPVAINRDPHAIQQAVKEVRPTCMCAVPRFWEKAYTAIQEKFASAGKLQQLLVKRALKVGRRRNLDYVRLGRKVPALLEAEYRFYDRMVFSVLRRAIGIERGNIFPTAGAPLSANIVEFFHSCGINILIGYGLSETTATVTCFPTYGYEIGSVGTVMPRLEVRIGANNEIQVKGPTVMREYFGRPEATAEAFTADGWFRTGDAGYFDASGALVLTERIKDLFKTSNGKYIAPQALESRLGEDRFIEQVAVIGDHRKYVTAIIIPAFEALKEYARRKSIKYRNVNDLVENSEIHTMLQQRIDKLQRGFAGFEKIKKFTLLPKAFTIESGELTNTLKLRRGVINRIYAPQIEAMYA